MKTLKKLIGIIAISMIIMLIVLIITASIYEYHLSKKNPEVQQIDSTEDANIDDDVWVYFL